MAAAERNIGVLMDLVPNHSSDQHPWFLDSRSSRDAAHRRLVRLGRRRPTGTRRRPPEQLAQRLRRPGLDLRRGDRQWYLHHFVPEQPDFNWWNAELREEFDRILRFWFDRGVAGFRIDVCHMIIKDKELRDNPPSTSGSTTRPADARSGRAASTTATLSAGGRDLRPAPAGPSARPRRQPGRTPASTARGRAASGLQLPFFRAPIHASRCAVRRDTEAALRGRGRSGGPNHDVTASRPGRRRTVPAASASAALLLSCGARPSSTTATRSAWSTRPSPTASCRTRWASGAGRSWTGANIADADAVAGRAGAGFTGADVATWLPIGDNDGCNVADQRDDPDSTLTFCRTVLAAPPRARGPAAGRVPPARRARRSVGLRPWRRHHRGVEPVGRGAGGQRAGDGRLLLSTSRPAG